MRSKKFNHTFSFKASSSQKFWINHFSREEKIATSEMIRNVMERWLHKKTCFHDDETLILKVLHFYERELKIRRELIEFCRKQNGMVPKHLQREYPLNFSRKLMDPHFSEDVKRMMEPYLK